jgi:uncharacterized protein with FMN-binding domain
MRSKVKEFFAILIPLLLIFAAIIVGKYNEKQNSVEVLSKLYPNFEILKTSNENLFIVSQNNQGVKYISLGEGSGFGGKITVLSLIDSSGFIKDIQVINHSETPSFFVKVKGKKFLNEFIGNEFNALIKADVPIDAICGATYTSNGIQNAIMNSSIPLIKQFSLSPFQEKSRQIKIWIPEIALVLLYLIGFVFFLLSRKMKSIVRWIAIFISIICIGFIGMKMLTISNIGVFLLGDFPDFSDYFFWYLLIAGVLFSIIFQNKNHYCSWVCPFGRLQDVIGTIGNAKPRLFKYQKFTKGFQSTIALIAILIGLVYRNPAMTSYEVFSGVFSFTGSSLLFIVLGITIVFSLFIKNPWCNYLCPVKPSINFLRRIRRFVIPQKK